jgi:thiol-disulfide isomerase/thioredoxin
VRLPIGCSNRLTGLALVGIGMLALAAVAPLAAQDAVGIPLGAVPEAVEIEDLAGIPVDLGEVIGRKPVLIEFWATWCPVCAELQPRFEAARAKYGEEVEFIVVAVAVNQTKRSIERHLTRNPMPGRILWDTSGRATRAFLAPTTSYVVVLDAAGRVVYTGVGGDQDLEGAVGRAL